MLASTPAPTAAIHHTMLSIPSIAQLIQRPWHRRTYGTDLSTQFGNSTISRQEYDTEMDQTERQTIWISVDIARFYEEHCQPSSGSAWPACPKTVIGPTLLGAGGSTQFGQGLPDRCDSFTACRLCRFEYSSHTLNYLWISVSQLLYYRNCTL